MSSARSVQAALNKLARLALEATGADRSAILSLDPRGGIRLIPAAGASRLGEMELLWEKFTQMEAIDVEDDPERFMKWTSNRVVTIEDAQHSQLLPPQWREAWGSQSVAFVKLRAGGELFGILGVDYARNRHTFQEEERNLLESIAGAAGVALRTANLVERLQQAINIERRLSECTSALSSTGSLADVLDQVAERFISLLPGTTCSINLLSPGRSSFRTVAQRGLAWPAAEVQISSLPERDVNRLREMWSEDSHRPVVVKDVHSRRGWTSVVHRDVGPGMLLPLSEEEDVIGFVAVGRSKGQFAEEEIRVAKSFANHVAVAVHQARLTDALAVRFTIIEAFNRLSGLVSRTAAVRSVLSELNQTVGQQLGIECVAVTFADPIFLKALHLRRSSPKDLALIRNWRHASHLSPLPLEDLTAVPILIKGRAAGVLRVRATSTLGSGGLEFVRAVASGLGELAVKAKLRYTAERRLQELAVSAERERIARDLHDTVGQALYGIGLKLEDALHAMRDPGQRTQFEELRSLTGQTIAHLRSSVYALSFLSVKAVGFSASLRALAKQFSTTTSIPVEVRIDRGMTLLSEEVENALYRMAHEALVNVDRHARATGVVMTLSQSSDGTSLEVRDDGVGFDSRQAADWQSAAHYGLRAIATSIQREGGIFNAFAARPRGLVIRATIPLRRGSGRQKTSKRP